MMTKPATLRPAVTPPPRPEQLDPEGLAQKGRPPARAPRRTKRRKVRKFGFSQQRHALIQPLAAHAKMLPKGLWVNYFFFHMLLYRYAASHPSVGGARLDRPHTFYCNRT